MNFIREHKRWLILILIIFIYGIYHIWRISDRCGFVGPAQLNISRTFEFSRDTGNGNIVAIQPWMLGVDYSCEEAFYSKLDGYFKEADKIDWLNDNTIVVLPEYLGAWLLCVDEKRAVYKAPTINEAMMIKVLSNITDIISGAISAPCKDRIKYAIFQSSARKSAEIYDRTLSALARKYHVTIVGGSIILPTPYLADGRLRTTGRGPLLNVSPVYKPDGNTYPELVVKAYVTADEKDFVSPGDINDLPVFDTPAGKLGVMICADSWFPQAYAVLDRKNADIIAVSSFISGKKSLKKIWKGYSNAETPTDVDPSDPHKITSMEAWKKYTLYGRLPASGIPYGIMSCLRGELWDLGSDSFICAIQDGQPEIVDSPAGATLTNLWISTSRD